MALQTYGSIFRVTAKGNLEVLARYLDSGTDIDGKGGQFHCSPLLEACRFHKVLAAKLLLERGASIESRGGGRWGPLHYAAAEKDDFDLVELLLEHDCKVDSRDYNERTPLHIAASAGHFEAAMALLERGANANALDVNGQTPLHYACAHREVTALLLGCGSDVGALDREKETPLHKATRGGHYVVCNLLKQSGADPNALNCWGELAGSLAKNCKVNPPPPEEPKTKCRACTATQGRHYYFCIKEEKERVGPTMILEHTGVVEATVMEEDEGLKGEGKEEKGETKGEH